MAASQNDLFRKTARRWVSQVGAGGVSDAVVTTIPLSSATNLPTDTGVTLTIDRVDANGKTTADKEETITGVVSGSNIVSTVRGVEGTAQAHDAGAVVELLFSNKIWNDFIDGMMTAFNQDGTIKDSTVLTTPQINNAAKTYQYVFAPSALTADRTVTLPLLTGADTFVFASFLQTLTGKRITPRVVTATSYTTDTGTSLNCDTTDRFIVTAQAGALKFNNPSGTGTESQFLTIRIKDDGTARALTWDTQFRAMGTALPSTTVLGKTLYLGFMFNITDTKWDLLASGQEA
jgi:hypothetical protein